MHAPPGQAVTAIRPHSSGDPTLLRLRAAKRDWYVDSHTSYLDDFPRRRYRLPSSVVVSYAKPKFVTPQSEYLPSPIRYPHSVARGCTEICVGRFLYRPGRRLTVPGVFTMRVLRGRPVRVRTRWLDRTPPALTVASSAVVPVFGAAPQLMASVRADARGAGVLAVEVNQNGAITRVPADSIRGLVNGRRGRGTVRVPLAPGAVSAAIRLVDAAGNASPWTPLDLSRRVRAPPSPSAGARASTSARLRACPARGRSPSAAAPIPPSQALRSTSSGPGSGRAAVAIAPDGTFSTVWTPRTRDRVHGSSSTCRSSGCPTGSIFATRTTCATCAGRAMLKGIVVVPVQVAGKRAPSAAKLRRMLDRASRWYAKASNNRIRLQGAIAPTFVAGPLTRRLQSEQEYAFLEILDWAAARGVPVDGALPIYVGPGLRNPWYGGPHIRYEVHDGFVRW